MNMQNSWTECKVRVESGDLASQGTGKMATTYMSDGRFSVRVLLPDETGTPKRLDLTTIERVELVDTRAGWFDKGQWTKPLAALLGAFIGVPLLLKILTGTATMLATPIFFSGIYIGTKRTHLARFVVVAEDGKYAVLEGPESSFHFMNGIYAVLNIQKAG